MNLANKLTLSRLALAVIFIGVFLAPLQFANTTALIVFLAAALTDIWDGRVARHRNEKTVFGELIDPLADKILVLSAFISFVAIQFPNGKPLVPVWAVVIIIAREFAVMGLRVLAAGRGQPIAAGLGGKQKTISQLVAVIVILAGEALDHDWGAFLFAEKGRVLDYLPTIYLIVTLVAVTLTITSGLTYFWQHRRLLETQK